MTFFSLTFFCEKEKRKEGREKQKGGVVRQNDVCIIEKRLHHNGMLTEEELQKRVTDRLTPDLAKNVFTTFEVCDIV